MSVATIPGTFLDPAVGRLRWFRHGTHVVNGIETRLYRADVVDGLLTAVVGHEPVGSAGRLLWHVSVAHRQFVDDGEHFVRYPTWDELKHAKYTLIPADVPMVLIFPRRTVAYVDDYASTLHLWESEDGTIDQ